MKRSISEIISSNPYGDALWDFALDAQDKAVSSKSTHKAYKYFKIALEYAKASRSQYILGASINPENKEKYLQNATLAEDELIKPFKERIEKLRKLLDDAESDVNNLEAKDAVQPLSTSVDSPEVISFATFHNTFFAPLKTNHINSLFSLKDFANLDEIDFITGSPLNKIQSLVNRLSVVIQSKVLETELPGDDVKCIKADDLLNISRDCTQKLFNWIKPYSSEVDYNVVIMSILSAAQKAAKSAKSIYELVHPFKVKICKGQLSYINQQIQELQTQPTQGFGI